MSECGVCLSFYDDYDSGPSFYGSVIRKARKQHRCCECQEEIKPGEQYEDVSGMWDDGIFTYKTCLPCTAVRDGLSCGGSVYGELWEAVSEILPSLTTGCLSKIDGAAGRQKLLDFWNDWRFGEDAR